MPPTPTSAIATAIGTRNRMRQQQRKPEGGDGDLAQTAAWPPAPAAAGAPLERPGQRARGLRQKAQHGEAAAAVTGTMKGKIGSRR